MSARSSERISLAGELRRAVTREEFRVHLQPKVEIRTGRVVGAEALIRWHHPKRGLLAPSEFMGFAEEIGLGPQIGDWLLRTSLSYCQRRKQHGGRVLPIALNVSNSQFRVARILGSSHGSHFDSRARAELPRARNHRGRRDSQPPGGA